MFFRFAAGLLLVVLVSMVSVRLEKQTLEMRRAVSVQYYQTDVLLELLVRLRLETQKLTAPAQLAMMKDAEKKAPATDTGKSRKTNAKAPQRSATRSKSKASVREQVAEQTPTVHSKEKTPPARSRVATDDKRAFSPDDDHAIHPPLLRVLNPFNPQGLD